MWSDRIIFYWGGFKKWMLSLLLNKNPRLSLGVVSHGVPWSLVCLAGEVRRRHDGSKDACVNGRMNGSDRGRGYVATCLRKIKPLSRRVWNSIVTIVSSPFRRAFIHSTFQLLSVGWGTLCEIKYLPKDRNVSSMTKAGEILYIRDVQ